MHVIVPEVTAIRPVFRLTSFAEEGNQTHQPQPLADVGRQNELQDNNQQTTLVASNLTANNSLEPQTNVTNEIPFNSTSFTTVVSDNASSLNASSLIAQEYLAKPPFRRLRNRFHNYFSPKQVQLRRQQRRRSVGNVMLKSRSHIGPYLT